MCVGQLGYRNGTRHVRRASAQAPERTIKACGEPWLRQLIVRLATRSGLPSRVCSPSIRAARCRNMELVRVQVRRWQPRPGVWQRDGVGRINRSRSRSIAITRAAFLSVRRNLREPWNSDESGDEFTSHSTVEVLDANGNVIATFCAVSAGTRFE